MGHTFLFTTAVLDKEEHSDVKLSSLVTHITYNIRYAQVLMSRSFPNMKLFAAKTQMTAPPHPAFRLYEIYNLAENNLASGQEP